MANYCTLFDSGYLDRGIALYRSLERVTDDFTLYIFCFDDIAYNVLKDIHLAKAVPIRESDFLDEELTQIKENRGHTEYCWSCTPRIIEYVLDCYHAESCTYIDADMLFYDNPNILVDGIPKEDSVGIIGHRFAFGFEKKNREKKFGKYCVEFNTFKNNPEGRKVLNWWKEQCYRECSMKVNGETYGDQKYVDYFQEHFEGIYEQEHLGAGIAPWNIADYTLKEERDNKIIVKYKNKLDFPMVFYHFQGLKMIAEKKADIMVYNELGKKDRKLIDRIYIPYVRELTDIQKWLRDQYGVEVKVIGKKKDIRIMSKNLRDLIRFLIKRATILYRGKRNIVEID